MRKSLILAFALICTISVLAQDELPRDFKTMKALSWSLGLPVECRDLPGLGNSVNIGYDCAYPINDHFALGFYINGGIGYWSEFKEYSKEDNDHISFRLNAGLMMKIGDLEKRPFLLGVSPCTGFGLYDLDMVLPVEVRFGRYLTDRWYLMGELTYHISLANETAVIEPAIRAGFNFGRKPKSKKTK